MTRRRRACHQNSERHIESRPVDNSKIDSPELQRLAAEGSPETRSVIIELDVVRPTVQFALDRHGRPRPVATSLERETERSGDIERTSKEVHEFLTTTVGVDPLWLRAARAFVADVSGAQLDQIAKHPMTRVIRPNRKLL